MPRTDSVSFLIPSRGGAAEVRMDGGFLLVEKRRVLVVDATTPVGLSIAKVFTGLVLREFGEDAFRVDRIVDDAHATVASVTTRPSARSAKARR